MMGKLLINGLGFMCIISVYGKDRLNDDKLVLNQRGRIGSAWGRVSTSRSVAGNGQLRLTGKGGCFGCPPRLSLSLQNSTRPRELSAAGCG